MENKFYVYKATNKLTGQVFIGSSTIDLEQRRRVHEGRESHFGEIIRQYGPENFEWEVIDTCKSYQEMEIAEAYWILKYDATNPEKGYNKRIGTPSLHTYLQYQGMTTTERIKKLMEKGYKGGKPKLPKETIKKLFELYDQAIPARKIAESLGISHTTIYTYVKYRKLGLIDSEGNELNEKDVH